MTVLVSETARFGALVFQLTIAVQMVLGLVEPQASGIGGGAFILHFEAAKKTVTTFDGREAAPMGVTPELFLDSSGKPLRFAEAVVGGRSVGAPGTVRALALAHERYGKLPWASLFEPAITLAEQGAISERAGRPVQHFAAPTVRVVETTAAGDIWHGALAYGLARGADFADAVALAIAAASDSVTRPGGRASMPARPPILND